MSIDISFNTITKTEAESFHLAKTENTTLPTIKPIKSGSGKKTLNSSDLYELTNILDSIKNKYPDILPVNRGNKFDIEVLPVIHKHFMEYSLKMVTCAGFWRWFSIMAVDSFFYDLIEWRFKSSEGKIVGPINWGIANDNAIRDYYFYYCWLRADVGFDETIKHKYEIAKTGDADFWRSHIFRQDYGKDRILVKAILNVIFKDDHYNFTIKTIRHIFIPKIRAWYATGSFSHLNLNECIEVVKMICDRVEEEKN